MKRLRWCLGLLLVGTLLFVSSCGPGLIEQLETQAEDLQEQVDALEARISALEFVPPVLPLPPLDLDSTGYSDMRVPIEAFQDQPHIDVAMSTILGWELTITLGSNPTTGYRWSEDAEISDKSIVRQSGHKFESPGIDEPPGTPGEETWVFKGTKRGTTTILLEYSRSWETSRTPGSGIEGVRDASLWTVTITATIK